MAQHHEQWPMTPSSCAEKEGAALQLVGVASTLCAIVTAPYGDGSVWHRRAGLSGEELPRQIGMERVASFP
jgi:hypothetical protein